MDIFNLERVAILEKENEGLQKEVNELKKLLARAETDLETALEAVHSKPVDCTPGEYCKACEFSKNYYYWHHGYHSSHDFVVTGYFCDKGNSCKNFIQKEVTNDRTRTKGSI